MMNLNGEPLAAREQETHNKERSEVLLNLKDTEMPRVSMDRVLMPEHSEDAEWMALRRDAVEEGIGEEDSDEYQQNHHANWHDLHHDMLRSQGCRWPP